MSTSVVDFHDLLRALEEHPEWRAELRRLILSEEFLTLPVTVRRLEEELAKLAATVERLVESQEQMQAAIRELTEAQARTENALKQLTLRVDTMSGQLGDVRGQLLEIRFREKAPANLGRFLRKVQVLPAVKVAELLDQAVDAGRLNWEERQTVLLADAVVQGVTAEGAPTTLVVEVSGVVDERDVARAVERAELFAKALETPAQAVVMGQEIPNPVRSLAQRLGVWCLEDGHRVT
ncbi:MAG: hypothetical protein ACK42L_08270 [Thermoanaerobaculum sp.]